MPINPDAFERPASGGPDAMTVWLGEIKAAHTELRRITQRFHQGGLEAGGRITANQRQRLNDRFDAIIATLRNQLRTANIP